MGTVGVVHAVTDLGSMTVEPKIILRNIPVAIPVYDDRGRITDIRRNFEGYFGVLPVNVAGTKKRKNPF